MKEINIYIAYLLTRHECVVLPEFGAFVTSAVSASKKELDESFISPARFLGFNPEIKHNDGLLINFLSVVEKISYKEADLLVKQYVERLYEQLYNQKSLTIKWLGELSFASENKIIFMPDVRLSCNAVNFGFDSLDLFSLKKLSTSDLATRKKETEGFITISINRRVLIRTGSVAAAMLALLFSSTPLNNSGRYTAQNASFFTTLYNFETQKNKPFVPIDTIQTATANNEDSLPEVQQIIEEKINIGNYYIIIASFPSKSVAEEKLSDFKKDGFSQATIISNANKHRIYIDQFEKKADAELYLIEFRRNNPQYADAWLLIQRD